MSRRLKTALVAGAILLAAHTVARTQQNPSLLKDTDQTKLCLSCHTDFEQTLQKKVVHGPVQSGDCSGCHNPHVSNHPKLLSAEAEDVCAGCHDSVVPAGAKSTHQPVRDGECVKCHDPHASDFPAMAPASGNELCLQCHKELGDAIAKARFRHSPVQQGCSTCHVAHGSDKAASLLKSAVPGLCLSCHKPDTPAFTSRHNNYPVAKADCTSCHDPHGSGSGAILFTNLHAPIANRMCNQCHEGPDSATPFATKRAGFELCKGCHNDMVVATMGKSSLHWPVATRDGCVSCHEPHASKHPKLLRADTKVLCGTCHGDTLKRIAAVTVPHAPVRDGMCTACHSPHSANGRFLVDQPSFGVACGACHDYGQHSAHPIGEEAIDPRNKNLRVDCLSCHNGHGTNFKRMLLAETNIELCTPCHRQYAR